MRSKSNKRKKRIYIVPTRYGFIYLAMVITVLSVGVAFNNTSVLFLTAILVMFGIICMNQTNFNVAAVRLKKFEPESGFTKQTVPWKLEFANEAPVTSFSLDILDTIVDIPRGDSTENIKVELKKRGRLKIKEIKISSTYPLGLFYSWKIEKVDIEYFAYPELLNESVLDKIHEERSSRIGLEDFLGHKDYVEGEPHRHIDWKAQARRQKLLVKVFDSHGADTIIIDWNDLGHRSIEEKLSAAATAVHECYRLQKPFALLLPQISFPSESNKDHYKRCLEALAEFEALNV